LKGQSVRIIASLVCSLCLLAAIGSSARADMTGAGDAAIIVKLTTIYNAIKEQYQKQVELIKEAKVQTENMQKVKEMAVTVKKEYDFARNFNIERELNNIKDDMGGLTLLDNMDGKSPERQFEMLSREINRRFEANESKSSDEAKRKLAAQLASLQRLMALQKSKAQEAEALASGTKTDKEVQASAASSCALVAALELAREQRRIEEEMRAVDQQYQKKVLDQTYENVVDKMAEKK